MEDLLKQINAYLTSKNLELTLTDLNSPNKWHPIKDDGVKGGYIYNSLGKEDAPIILFTLNDWIKGSFTETFSTKPLTPQEKASVTKKQKDLKELEQKEKEKRWNDAKAYCQQEYSNSSTDLLHNSSYLRRKQTLDAASKSSIRARANIVNGTTELIVPLTDVHGEQWGHQIIRDSGEKSFYTGQRYFGVGFTIHGPDTTLIYLCEGVATALSIASATEYKYTVYAAMSSGNLKALASEIRGKYERARIIVCADNDQWKPHLRNPGVQSATDCVSSTDGAACAIPDFSGCETSSKPTDYNDLHCLQGLPEVKRQLDLVKTQRPFVLYTLGYREATYYFSSSRNPSIQAIREFSSSDFAKIAPQQYWERNFGSISEKSGKVTIDYEAARFNLIDKSQRHGFYNEDIARGCGVWVDNNEVIINTGSKIVTSSGEYDLQDYKSEYIYEPGGNFVANSPFNPPTENDLLRVKSLDIAMSDLSFERPFDYKLLLGWLLLAPLSGALKWRPHLMLTASAGSGKSTIIDNIVKPLLKDYNLYHKVLTTEASVRQTIRNSATPCLFDEFDSNLDDPRKLQGILNLCRAASSGGDVGRGTSGGKAKNFTARFMALMAGVNPPKLSEADASRITELNISKNHKRTDWGIYREELYLAVDKAAPSLLKIGVERVANINASASILLDVLGATFGPRTGQQYGTLMAGYWHLFRSDVIGVEEAGKLLEEFKHTIEVEQLDSKDIDIDKDEYHALLHLLDLQLLDDNKDKISLGMIISSLSEAEINAKINPLGMKIKNSKLFIPNQSAPLDAHFRGTKWPTWTKTLRRLNGTKLDQIKIGGVSRRGIWVEVERDEERY